MQEMKIKVTKDTTSAVQAALFILGYKWCSGDPFQYPDKPYLYASAEGIITYSSGDGYGDREYFESHRYPEYRYSNGMLLSLKHLSDPEPKAPVGLRPRDIAVAEAYKARVSEILQAMTRYNDAGKAFPAEWIAELQELNA